MRLLATITLLLAFAASGRAQCPEIQKIIPHDGATFGNFGTDAALEGDVALIGSGDDPSSGSTGQVHVFRYDTNVRVWSEEAELFPADGDWGQSCFGCALALQGQWVIVGHPNYLYAFGVTWVYQYDAPSGDWQRVQKIEMPDPDSSAEFGSAVAIDGDVVVIGARLRDDPIHGKNAGAAYIYRYVPSTPHWLWETILADGSAGELNGAAVGVSGDVIAVGTGASIQGAVSLYRFDGAAWRLEQRLVPPDGGDHDEFGRALALRNDRLLVGAPYHLHGGAEGAAYVYRYDTPSATWQLEQELLASDRAVFDLFGYSVAMDGDRIGIGSWYHDAQTGVAYVFRRFQGWWVEDQKLIAGDAKPQDELGTAVALSGDRLLATAPNDNNINGYRAGAGYLFTAAELTLDAQPHKVFSGQPLTMKALCGRPGDPVLIAAVVFNGSGVFLPVLLGAFAPNDALVVSANAPPDLAGDNVLFQAFKFGLGNGRVVASSPVEVKFR